MRKNVVSFLGGFITAVLLLITVTVSAEDIYQKIDVIFNSIKVVVHGELKSVDNLVYNGSTYIKLRDLSNVFGNEVEWNGNTKTAYIDEKGSLKLKSTFPTESQTNFYPLNGFLSLTFSEDMKGDVDPAKIQLVSEEGERIKIKSAQIGYEENNTISIVPADRRDLRLGSSYSLIIPRNTFESLTGKKYNRDINMSFKVADTVLNGKVTEWEKLVKSKITLVNLDTNEVYNTVLANSGGSFVFYNINGGHYKFVITNLDGKKYEKEIFIEQGFVNNLNFFPEFN